MGSVDEGARVGGDDAMPAATAFVPVTRVTSTIVNIPNGLSAVRLLGVPLFVWLVLVPHADGLALLVLMVSGWTDYLDGKLARQWDQISRIGQLLDPLADRLYIIGTVYAFTVRGVIPVPLAVVLLSRDVILAAFLPLLRRRGYGPLPVHFLGKAATFNLLYAFPLLLLAEGSSPLAAAARPVGWAFTVWGTFLYWWAALLYARQFRQLIVADRMNGAPA
ncbi:MAG: CDP-alcohol phosphatidyltransferase family protein [Actinomycetota bacterium]